MLKMVKEMTMKSKALQLLEREIHEKLGLDQEKVDHENKG